MVVEVVNIVVFLVDNKEEGGCRIVMNLTWAIIIIELLCHHWPLGKGSHIKDRVLSPLSVRVVSSGDYLTT